MIGCEIYQSSVGGQNEKMYTSPHTPPPIRTREITDFISQTYVKDVASPNTHLVTCRWSESFKDVEVIVRKNLGSA